MGVKIKDIAERAKVSPATVSFVLNNRPGVSESTRKRVMTIARELNYKSFAANSVNQVRKGTIRFLKIAKHEHVINRDHDVFIADYIDGLAHEARSIGYALEINTFRSVNMEEIIGSVEGSSIEGVIVLGTELSPDDIEIFKKLSIPVVFIDTYYNYLDFDFVDMNNIDSVFQIISHFIENGHTQIGFIRSDVSVKNFYLREQGFVGALQNFGIQYNDAYVYTVDSTFQGAYTDMCAHLKKSKKLPTALFSSNDIIAYGCIKAMKEAGIRVPDDVSVIGFDDLPLSAVMDPHLTTMKVSKKRIGRISMMLINAKLRSDPHLPPAKIVISGKLVCRNSVKPVS